MLNYEFPPIGGGAANAHLNILKEYSKMPDIKVDVLTSMPKPGFAVENLSENITVFKVGVHKKQLQTYLKLTGCKLGYLLNFNEELMKHGITRCVNKLEE